MALTVILMPNTNSVISVVACRTPTYVQSVPHNLSISSAGIILYAVPTRVKNTSAKCNKNKKDSEACTSLSKVMN